MGDAQGRTGADDAAQGFLFDAPAEILIMRGVVVTLALLSICCGGSTASSPTATAETLEPRVTTEHFRLLAGTTADSAVRAAVDRLEAEYPRILRELNLTALPVIHGPGLARRDHLLQRADALPSGVRYGVPPATSPVRPNCALLDGPRLPINAGPRVHPCGKHGDQRAHPQQSALVLGGRWRSTRTVSSSIRARSITWCGGAFPTLQQLNVDPNGGTQIYQLGYVIGDFIVGAMGPRGVPAPDRDQRRPAGVLGVSPPSSKRRGNRTCASGIFP
jgi:hypothetical protein